MGFDMLTDSTGSHLFIWPVIREKLPFGRGEPVSQPLEECWLLSDHLKSSYSPD